ncbi:MAG: phosphate signaling complex protein PhoU [Acidimicrobiaceae bacterium]|nr:phosphate signaling complex protein PhoU [Acidimicrobiaceae bacterium]MCY4175992.1 phosphate signaling complex protein PhoU [Acidimicrobiaceae bacterium]MCY4280442.1 phosphate signaling complex protein PhoU [Acidimicrobiaceae bacterium]MCY4294550.1 phosphate signaling complex protein PhoU [Acidimicrobiaceae bacterium]
MTEQTRRGFHADIEEISELVVRLAARVGDSVARATDALLNYDLAAAQRVIDDDGSIDVAAFEIEEQCQNLLALQQPMAGDLRQILATMLIIGELERTGGLACNICKGARRMFRTELPPRLRGLIAEMNEEAIRLIRLSVDSYSEHDSALAGALDDIDDRLDNLHRSFIQSLLEASRSHDLEVQPAVQLALIARYYERIGDHAVNISDRVRYMVSGEMPWREEQLGARLEELPTDPADVSLNGETKTD